MAPLSLASTRGVSSSSRCFRGPRSAANALPRPARCLVVRASKGKEEDNPYHDRKYTKAKGTLGGTKDINAQRKDKQDQFEYQQERLEWRRKNQGEGIEDREEPPHTNMAKEPDFSAEKRGPEVKDSPPDTASLKDPRNALGNAIRKITGAGGKEDKGESA